MIDTKLLKELGWSEELIKAVETQAPIMRAQLLPNAMSNLGLHTIYTTSTNISASADINPTLHDILISK